MSMFLIAVKREKRREMSLRKAIDFVTGVEGVRVLDDPDRSHSVRVFISDNARPEVDRRLANYCHIESIVEHMSQMPALPA